ncbi:MAG: MazG nucleotide pyrophosphohydrolase domain-containing protein [Gammaproteobacteria bacterium]|nr:MazG nucleotide pyrophosphohydrolase domain-containing protein [Gammaproteobacteria bacterium]
MNLFEKIISLEHEADAFGFRWETTDQIMEQITSECQEIDEHLHVGRDNARLQEEIGDLLHAVFSLCVFCKLDPQTTVEKTTDKFARRLAAVKQIATERGLNTLKGHSFDELMKIWHQAKERVK